jgi:hypothetical protein
MFWVGWGYEYHHCLPELRNELYDADTKEALRHLAFLPSKQMPYRLLQVLGADQPFQKRRASLARSAIRRADTLATPIPEDFEHLKASTLTGQPRFVPMIYADVERACAIGPSSQGTGILVGNSGTPENNHLRVLRELADSSLSGRDVLVPLTYGPRDYRRYVVRTGRRMLGSRFKPILRHMPLDEYAQLLSQCDTAIMNHRRQQGLGTIHTLLYKGAKVVVDRRNPIHAYLERSGFYFGTISSTPLSGNTIKNDLSLSMAAHNRAIVEENQIQAISRDALREWFRTL